MNYNLKLLVIFIIFSEALLTNLKNLSPLSQCFKGRVSNYIGWEKNSSCGFEPHINATGPYYIYPIAPNEDLFTSIDHCGVCYEMVGLSGVIRVRVENFCSKDEESGFCSGDIYHFKLPGMGLNYLIGSEELSHITFRMVDCGFSGNIRILMDIESNIYSLSFIVLDHNLAISSVSLQEYKLNSWEKLNRNQKNYWIYDTGSEIEFPIKIRIYSIKGDYVTVNINKLNGERIYEANGNFKESNDTFFNITTLEKEEMPNNTRSCCERDHSVFSPIYNNGEINDYYSITSQKVSFDYNITEKYESKNTMWAKFQSNGKLSIQSSYPIRADQFSGVSIVIKASKICSDCIYFNANNLQKNLILNYDSENKWIKFRFDFKSMGIENNQFNGISLNYYKKNGQPFEIYIGSIDLIGKRIKPDAGVCLLIPFNGNEEDENIPIHAPEVDTIDKTDISDTQDNNSTSNKTDEQTFIKTENITNENDNFTEIISEIIESNATSLTYVNIKNIQQINFYLINIKCENFTKIENESMILLFESLNNSNYTFETVNCQLDDNESILSFSCQLPEEIPNGEYMIKSPIGNKYLINFSNKILFNDRDISFDIIIDTTNKDIETETGTTISNNTEIKNSTEENTEQTEEINHIINSPIVITNSINQLVKKGEIIIFYIEPIEQDKYHLENNEMIFTDNNKTKFLFLKNCKKLDNNYKIIKIECRVSNNIMEGTYTSLIEGKNISIQPGQNINLKIDDTIGGIINESIDKTIDTNISSSQFLNLTFNILYFNSNVIPYSSFPHKVTLSGITKNKRNLEEINHNYIFNFIKCTTGAYSIEEPTAISYIRCIFPDFVPAGTYSKLESDGFDINPYSKINIVFKEDFNRSLGGFNDDKKSSSSVSKKWIIWLVVGLILLILIIIIIISYFSNSKKNFGKNNNNSNSNNESKGHTENSDQNIRNSE